jgi:hypothetical protein
MMKLRRSLTELLLEVTNEEIALIAKDVYATCKGKKVFLHYQRNIDPNIF